MAKYKVCKSTRRIAIIDLFPLGAVHPIDVSIIQIRYYDSDDECYARGDSLGHFYVESIDQMLSLLKCFGLDWCDSLGYDDALEVLNNDYEERKRALDRLSSFQEV